MGLLDKLVRGGSEGSRRKSAPHLDQTTFGTGTLGGEPAVAGAGSDTATGTGAPAAGEWAAKPPAVPRPNRTAAFVLLVIVVLIVWAIAFSTVGGGRRARDPKAPTVSGKAPTKDQIASEIAALEEERRRQERLEQLRAQPPAPGPRGSEPTGMAAMRAPGASQEQLARELEERMKRGYGQMGPGVQALSGAVASPEVSAMKADPLAPGWGAVGGRPAAVNTAPTDPALAGLPPELQQLYQSTMRNLNGGAGAYAAQLSTTAAYPDAATIVVPGGGNSAPSGASGGFYARHGAGYLTDSTSTPVLDSALAVAQTPYLIAQGTLLPAILETELNSELPGQARALLRSNVYDTHTGTHLLLPQGSRLIGEYASKVTHGQRRLFLSWNRVLLPDGRTLQLGGMPGADLLGASGFSDRVDRHFLRIFGTALLLSVVSAGYEIAQGESGDYRYGYGDLSPADITRQAVASEFNRVANRMLDREMDVAPTLKIRSGYQFTIQVVADIVMPGAWKDSRGSALVALPQ